MSSKAKLTSKLPRPTTRSAAKSTVGNASGTVPDFRKLHQKWNDKLQKGKACVKKPCTIVQEFDLSKPGVKTEPIPTSCPNSSDRYGRTRSQTRQIHDCTPGQAIPGEVANNRKSRPRASRNPVRKNASNTGGSAVGQIHPIRKAGELTQEKEANRGESIEPVKSGLPEFQIDDTAKESILQNRGICNTPGIMSGTGPRKLQDRQTCADFKTPGAKPVTAMRQSVYYVRPSPAADPRAVSTECFKRLVSRLNSDTSTATAASSPQLTGGKTAGGLWTTSVTVPIRQSIYCRVIHPCKVTKQAQQEEEGETLDAPRSSFKAQRVPIVTPAKSLATRVNVTSANKSGWKAQRVPLMTPAKSPATRVLVTSANKCGRQGSDQKSGQKWKTLLGPKSPESSDKDKLAIHLDFAGESQDLDKLKAIEVEEERLKRCIQVMEQKKLEKKQSGDATSPDTEPTSQTLENITGLAHGGSGTQCASAVACQSANVESEIHVSKTLQLQRLKELKQAEDLVMKELASIENQREVNQTIETPLSRSSSTGGSDTGASQKRAPFAALSNSEIAKRSLQFNDQDDEDEDEASFFIVPDSPLMPKFLSDNSSRTSGSSSSGSSPLRPTPRKQLAKTLSPQRSPRVDKLGSPRSRSPKMSSKIKAVGSPLLSKVLCKGMWSPSQELSAFDISECIIDKENICPALFAKRSPLPLKEKNITGSEEVFSPRMLKSSRCDSMEQLNLSLSESMVQFEKLEMEAQDLQGGDGKQTGIDSLTILEKLDLIKRKQDRLMKLQMSLQKKLKSAQKSSVRKVEVRSAEKAAERTPEGRRKKSDRCSSARKRLLLIDEKRKDSPELSPAELSTELAQIISPQKSSPGWENSSNSASLGADNVETTNENRSRAYNGDIVSNEALDVPSQCGKKTVRFDQDISASAVTVEGRDGRTPSCEQPADEAGDGCWALIPESPSKAEVVTTLGPRNVLKCISHDPAWSNHGDTDVILDDKAEVDRAANINNPMEYVGKSDESDNTVAKSAWLGVAGHPASSGDAAKRSKCRRRSAFNAVQCSSRLESPRSLRPASGPVPSGDLARKSLYSPKPRMAGSAQIINPGGTTTPIPEQCAPISTPLALRSAARRAQTAHTPLAAPTFGAPYDFRGSSLFPRISISPDTQMSPLDLSNKSAANSAFNSGNSSLSDGSFSPDLTFSYVPDFSAEDESKGGTDSVAASRLSHADMTPYDATSLTPLRRLQNLVGPLSLAGNLGNPRHSPAVLRGAGACLAGGGPLRKCLLAETAQKYHDAMLDEEVALYACRLQDASPHHPATHRDTPRGDRCANPVARILNDGDDMHFIPIPEEGDVTVAGTGSAFMRCI